MQGGCVNVNGKLLFTAHLASCSVGLFVNVTVRPLIGILVKLLADEVRQTRENISLEKCYLGLYFYDRFHKYDKE